MNVFIVTGTSKGLGFSIIKRILSLEGNFVVICISRHKNEELEKIATINNKLLKYIEFDLIQLDKIEEIIEKIFSEIDLKGVKKLFLINNAGVLAPIKPLENIKYSETLENIEVNYISSLLLISNFLRCSKNSKANKYIINVSSKSAKTPVKNWACYSSAKAAMDNITKYIAIEYNEKSMVKSLSIHPPAMNTSMRRQNLREKNIFEKTWDFFQTKLLKKKKIYSSDEIAYKMIEIILHDNFHSGSVLEIS